MPVCSGHGGRSPRPIPRHISDVDVVARTDIDASSCELLKNAFPLMVRVDAGGAEEDRTPDLLLAKQVLSQLSYGPGIGSGPSAALRMMVGLGGFEPPPSPLSGARSNLLSYRPGRLANPATVALAATCVVHAGTRITRTHRKQTIRVGAPPKGPSAFPWSDSRRSAGSADVLRGALPGPSPSGRRERRRRAGHRV